MKGAFHGTCQEPGARAQALMVSEIPLVMFSEVTVTSMYRNLQPPVEGAWEQAKSTTKFSRNTGNAVAATDQAGLPERIQEHVRQ